jgi:hypothetical protein
MNPPRGLVLDANIPMPAEVSRSLFLRSVKLLPGCAILQDQDFKLLALSIARMRRKHGFALAAQLTQASHKKMLTPPLWHANNQQPLRRCS